MPSGLRLALLAALLAAGCTPRATTTPDPASFQARKAQAEKLTRQGHLAAALDQWRLLETLAPNAPEVSRQRRATEKAMTRKAEEHYRRAEAALGKRQTKKARDAYVMTLAFAPAHEGALRRLRDMDLAHNRKVRPKPQITKPYAAIEPPAGNEPETMSPSPARKTSASAGAPEKEAHGSAAAPREPAETATSKAEPVGAADRQSLDRAVALTEAGAHEEAIPQLQSYLADHPQDERARALLADAQRQVGLRLYRDGKLRESLPHLRAALDLAKAPQPAAAEALADAKGRLAKQAYENGLRAFQTDVSQAIVFWEEALLYDPQHLKAKASLTKAMRIRETLNSISEP